MRPTCAVSQLLVPSRPRPAPPPPLSTTGNSARAPNLSLLSFSGTARPLQGGEEVRCAGGGDWVCVCVGGGGWTGSALLAAVAFRTLKPHSATVM